MKKLIKIVQSMILAGLLILMIFSCSKNKWDEYYIKPDYLKEGSIMDVLAATSDYKEFSGLLRKTGYDSLLRRDERFTVFALKNGSYSGIDTTSDVVALKKIMGMHILPSALFKDKMGNNNFLSLSGKPLRFAVTQNGQTVNNIMISSFDKRVLNGVVHEVASVIRPIPNLYDFVMTDPDFSFFKSYIDSSYTKVIDPARNIITGFDTLGIQIYKKPIIYKQSSDYMSLVKIDSEMVVSTIFIPTANALNNCYSKMLTAREGNMNLFIPRLGKNHGDTTINYYFIPKNTAYIGDSAVLRAYITNNCVLPGKVSGFDNSSNSFINISGNQFVVNQNQILTDSTKYASNGYIYSLNDITLPDFVYRRSFIFNTLPLLPNPVTHLLTIPNPGVVYRNGVNAYPTTTGVSYSQFQFKQIGAELDIIMPFAIKGNYRVTLITAQWYLGSVSGYGTFDAFYGPTKLLRFTSGSAKVNIPLGIINVPVNGTVKFTFKAIFISGAGTFPLSAVLLEPVNAP